jgi:uncharacterized membrane protein
LAAILAVACFSFLMAGIIFPYLLPPFPTDIDFLLTKQDVLPIAVWRWAFYAHISTSLLTLLSGLTQFSRTIYLKYPRIHRFVGKIYVITLLFVSAPSGLLMAFYANGGLKTQVAFSLLSVLWWLFTFIAYRKIKTGHTRSHAAFMMRSYALTWSAVTLRLMQFAFGQYQLLDYETAYFVSAWCGWLLNLLFVEGLLLAGVLNYYFPKTT